MTKEEELAKAITNTVHALNAYLSRAYDSNLMVAVDVIIAEQAGEDREYVNVKIGRPL